MSYDCSFGRLFQWGSACWLVIIPRRGYEVRKLWDQSMSESWCYNVVMYLRLLITIWCRKCFCVFMIQTLIPNTQLLYHQNYDLHLVNIFKILCHWELILILAALFNMRGWSAGLSTDLCILPTWNSYWQLNLNPKLNIRITFVLTNQLSKNKSSHKVINIFLWSIMSFELCRFDLAIPFCQSKTHFYNLL